MFYVYVLKSLKNGRYYTGSTESISKRLNEHNTGRSKATKNTRPFELVYQESYNNRAEAYRREMYFKSGQGRAELKKLIG
jgi:putative endonuclease